FSNTALTRLNLRYLPTIEQDAIDDQFSYLHSLESGGLRHPSQPDNRDLLDPADDGHWSRYFRAVRRGAPCARSVRPAGIRPAAPVLPTRPRAAAGGSVAPAIAAPSVGNPSSICTFRKVFS